MNRTVTAALAAILVATTGCTTAAGALDSARNAATKASQALGQEPQATAPAGSRVTPAQVAAAKASLAGLPVKGLAPKTGYDRSCGTNKATGKKRACTFGPAWSDNTDAPMSHNGCDTKNDIKKRDMTNVTFKKRGRCVVATGTLADPWTGKTIQHESTRAKGGEVQIDHVRALADLWTHGAQNWTQAERNRWANHPLNLKAVDGKANSAHSDRTPAAWQPPNKATGWCEFGTRYVLVTVEANKTITTRNGSPALWVSKADKDMLGRMLGTCKKA